MRRFCANCAWMFSSLCRHILRTVSLSLDVEVENVIVTFNEEKDEYTLVEEGPQIERGTVFHRDACQREIYSRNICDKRLPREA